MSTSADVNYLGPGAFVAELVRSGVEHACITPGSRSTPLVLLLASTAGLRAWSHVDERSAAFFALGLARASRRPVVLACTSGTAAANFFPAVIEAHHARVPLIVLTADRPPELRDCAAGQTIDQLRLYGGHARWFFDVGTPETSPASLRHFRALGCRAVAEALGPPAGVAHLNFAFREPLVPADMPCGESVAADMPPRQGGDAAYTRQHAARPDVDRAAAAAVARELARRRRPLIVCGPLDEPDTDLAARVGELASALDAPVIAEPTSNLRRVALRPWRVDAAEALMRDREFCARSAPDAVVRLGAPPTSKRLSQWLCELDGTLQVVVDATGGWPDPGSNATHLLRGTTVSACAALASGIGAERSDGEARAWLEWWRSNGGAARAALDAELGDTRTAFEGHAVMALARTLPADAILYVGNSLAVRALDWFWPQDAPEIRVLANRGANGIDGFVSSVLGAAAASRRPVVGLCGDLSFYHDLNGLLAARRAGLRALFVVVHNDGGGIFDFLPIAQAGQVFEQFFVTAHGLDFRPAVEMYGCRFERVLDAAALSVAVERGLREARTSVVELAVGRAASVAAHARAFARAGAALGRAV